MLTLFMGGSIKAAFGFLSYLSSIWIIITCCANSQFPPTIFFAVHACLKCSYSDMGHFMGTMHSVFALSWFCLWSPQIYCCLQRAYINSIAPHRHVGLLKFAVFFCTLQNKPQVNNEVQYFFKNHYQSQKWVKKNVLSWQLHEYL